MAAVDEYTRQGFVAFSVDIQWDPLAKKGSGGKRSTHPRAWQEAGGKSRAQWNSVALNTGLSGLVVIDIDSDDSYVEFKSAAQTAGIPLNTREAKSGSGKGGHIYFKANPGAPALKSIDNIGVFHMKAGSSKIDIKAAGG
nr:DNA primase domain-containing protein [Oceanusvirus sp.]